MNYINSDSLVTLQKVLTIAGYVIIPVAVLWIVYIVRRNS